MTRIAFVMDSITSVVPYKDSTLAMIWAAQRRGWKSFYMQPQDLAWREGEVFAYARSIELTDNFSKGHFNDSDPWFMLGEEQRFDAAELDVVMMRKDPPFDMDYINTTYLLEQMETKGTLVINRPASLRDCNEKFFTTTFSRSHPTSDRFTTYG